MSFVSSNFTQMFARVANVSTTIVLRFRANNENNNEKYTRHIISPLINKS